MLWRALQLFIVVHDASASNRIQRIMNGQSETVEGDGFCMYTASCDSTVVLPTGQHGGFEHTCWQMDPLTWDRTRLPVDGITVTARAVSAGDKINVFLENERGHELAGTSQTLVLTEVDETWSLLRNGLPTAAYWVDLRSIGPTPKSVTYTVSFMAPGVCPQDLPAPCRRAPWAGLPNRSAGAPCASSPSHPPMSPSPSAPPPLPSDPPPVPPAPPPAPPPASPADAMLLPVALSLGLGVPLLALCVCLVYIVRREQQGQPIFVKIGARRDAPP